MRFFDTEFEKALKNSIFEYNTKFIAYIYRNDEAYRGGKLHCNNIQKKIVFHGTRSWAISRILAPMIIQNLIKYMIWQKKTKMSQKME